MGENLQVHRVVTQFVGLVPVSGLGVELSDRHDESALCLGQTSPTRADPGCFDGPRHLDSTCHRLEDDVHRDVRTLGDTAAGHLEAGDRSTSLLV
jgi:hypothetical protein